MPDMNFDCPQCGQNLEAPEDMAGQQIECPACGKSISIPASESPRRLSLRERVPEVSERSRDRACPECGAVLTSDTVLCIQCGYDFRTCRTHSAYESAPASQGEDVRTTAYSVALALRGLMNAYGASLLLGMGAAALSECYWWPPLTMLSPLAMFAAQVGFAGLVPLYGWRLSSALGSPVPMLWSVAMFVPLLNLIPFFVLNRKAKALLGDAGFGGGRQGIKRAVREAETAGGAARFFSWTGLAAGLVVGLAVSILTVTISTRESREQLEAEIRATRAKLSFLATSIRLHEVDTGKYPSSLEDLTRNPGSSAWNGPYCESGHLRDVWGREIQYAANGRDFVLVSFGPDGIESADDLQAHTE